MERSKFKNYLFLITYAILLFVAVQHISSLKGIFSHVVALLVPFIYGGIIAYLFCRPYNFFYNKVFIFEKHKKLAPQKGLRKVLSLVCVYFSAFMLIIAIFSLLVPQLAESIKTLADEIPGHYESLMKFSTAFLNQFELTSEFWLEVQKFATQLATTSINFVYNAIPNVLSSIINITSGITNFIFGLIISIYILSNKDKLCRQARQLTLAFLPEKVSRKTIDITALAHKTFSSFITGQLIDAFILGTLCFIGMSVLGFPYALLVSVIIGGSNIIPILGPILGTVPTTFIVLMADPTDPLKAVWFIVFVIALQQIDGNFIYPRVVGSSIGLSGLWVMFAILVFGGQFGLLGMIIGVPICAISYILIREATYKRLKQKSIPIVKDNH